MQESEEDDFDLGFDSSRKDKETKDKLADKSGSGGDFEADLNAGMSDDDGPMSAEQQKAIHDQFNMFYEKDPELRKALQGSNVEQFSVLEKYQIIEVYMQAGAAGLQIELEDDEDEKALMSMTPEEEEAIETQFAKLYAGDPELQNAMGDISQLNLLQKYQIIV